MKIVCDACSAKYSIADEKVRGKVFKIRCKKCSNIIVVRGTSEEAEAPVAAPPVDNKETKVFDYSGYDNPSEAMAAADPSDAAWHVVIDQEQVGPLSAADVRGRFAAGQLDGESYIWKEGFGDWQRIVDVPDFADLGQPEDPGVGMFGGPPIDDAAGSSSDPADLFGAASTGAAAGFAGGGGDLFGGAAAADAGADDGLFGGGAAAAGHGGEAVNVESQLRGQRNENSVLFSLNNLASLASEAPRASASPAAAPSPASTSQPGMAQAGGTEGSGLIDIRSMAQVYLGDRGGAGGGGAMPSTGSADDLPVFSQTAFESASPVLLPQQSAAANNKVIYGLIAAIGVLVLAATILLFVVFKGGDGEPAAAPVIAANQAGDEGDDGDEAADSEPAAADEAEGDDDSATAAAAADEAEAAADEPEKPEEKAEPEPKKPERRASRDRSRSGRDRDRTRSRRTESKPDPKPSRRDSVAEATSGGGCDEVTCLVEPDKACCKKYQRGGSRSRGGSSSSSNSNLPETLTRSDISKGIGKVRGRVTSCGDKHGGSGTVKVRIKIGGSGRITSATASGGGSSLRSCVVSAVKRASFRKTQKGMTVTYPFVFR